MICRVNIICLIAIAHFHVAPTFATGLQEINPPEAPDATSTLALVGGRLIDGRGGPPIENAVVVVRAAKILAAAAREHVVIPADAKTYDVSGKSILPGLIDSHFHSRNSTKTPVDYELRNGITSFRDPGHPFRFYDDVMQTDKTMPRVFICGAHLDAHPPVWPDQAIVIKDADHARRTVNAHVDRGASAIKVYFRLPLEHINAASAAAKQRGVSVTAHLELVDADDAIRAGVRGIEHVTSFGTALAEPIYAQQFKSAIHANSNARRELRHRLWANIDLQSSPRVKPLLDTIVKHEVFVSPTLEIFERRAGEKQASDLEAAGFTNMLHFVSLCHRAGAKLVVGSHTRAPFAKTGRAYQRELELLVEAGLTPLEAVTAGTLHGAEFFGIADRLGTLETGKTADLILIDGDPSQDIETMRHVSYVMLNGNWFDQSP